MPYQINKTEQLAIERFAQEIKSKLNIKKFILFGSRARGDSEPFSDIDLLVLTDRPRTRTDREQIADVSAEINVSYGVAISCLYFNEQEWENSDNINPLLKENVSREGIELVV
jgi:predicted nucleotidyltransferase